MYIIWDGKNEQEIAKLCGTPFIDQLIEVIGMHSKEGMPHHLLISDWHFDVDQYAISLIKKIGYPQGDCPYWSVDEKCPMVEVDEEVKEKYNVISSIEHSHIGNWKRNFIKKNGYDHGLELFVFKSIEDREVAKILYVMGDNYVILS